MERLIYIERNLYRNRKRSFGDYFAEFCGIMVGAVLVLGGITGLSGLCLMISMLLGK